MSRARSLGRSTESRRSPAGTRPGNEDASRAESARAQAAGALATAVLGLAAFILLLLAVSDRDRLAPLDREVGRAGRQLAETGLEAATASVTALGAGVTVTAVILVAAVALASARRPGAALSLALGLVVLVVAVDVLKESVGRVRPPGASPSLTTASFPSGHASYATVYGALAIALVGRIATRWRRAALVAGGLALTVAVGLTRLVLGAHYLSDVVAGWALGAAVFATVAATVLVIGVMRHTGGRHGARPPPGPDTPQ